MTTFLTDTFTDTTGTVLSSHTADSGSQWEALDFSLRLTTSTTTNRSTIQSNQLGSVTNGNNPPGFRHPATPGSAEYDVQADFIIPTHDGTTSTQIVNFLLGARLTSTGTASANVDRYYAGYVGANPKQYRIGKVVSNTLTLLTSVNEAASGTVTALFEVRDATKRLLIGGVQKLTTSDNSITQVGRVGLDGIRGSTTAGFIDNLTAADTTSSGVTGTAAQTLSGFTQAATGSRTVPAFTGTAAQTLGAFSQSASGTHTVPSFTASSAQTLQGFTQAAAGTRTVPSFTGTAAQTLGQFTQDADGTRTIPAFTGAAASTLTGFGQDATGTIVNPGVSGSAAQTLPGFSQAATGREGKKGTASQTLGGFTQAAAGVVLTPSYTGTVGSVLALFDQAATGTRTLPTIEGDIASTLTGFDTAAIAAFFADVDTPRERTLRIPAEDRVMVVAAENRRIVVPAESRVLLAAR